MSQNFVSKSLAKVFGSRNDRLLKSYRKRVEKINVLEPEISKLTDDQLRERSDGFKQQIQDGVKVGDLLPEIMAVARECMDRYIGIRQILNPEFGFDPETLPASARAMYDQVQAEAQAMEPEHTPGGFPAPGYLRCRFPVELYEAVRALHPESKPPFRARPFDVQLIGGMVLGEGKIAEMRTGEGKTIVAPLACYVACLESLSCHVVTVNDYLVQRDRDWVFPFYYGLGLTVGAIHPQHMLEDQCRELAKTPGHPWNGTLDPANPQHLWQASTQLKQEAYGCNVVYGTNSEFGFDYLRDNMKLSTQEQMQKQRDFCIIDEVDSILIDEARTPLIISGPAHQDAPKYDLADGIARHLMKLQQPWASVDQRVKAIELKVSGIEGDMRNTRDKAKVPAMRDEIKALMNQLAEIQAERDQHTQYFEVEPEKKASHLTHEGVAEAQKKAGIGSFYVGNNMDMPHLLENALRAHAIYQRDKDYVVKDGEVIIVDENTGRLMIGRQWSDGLHQAVESKEKVKVKEETQTLATVTIQNFFKTYQRLGGMTGTAITEATEFMEIYKLDVVAIPTNKPIARADRNDLIFMSESDKWDAILDEIKRVHDLGQPVLVGTTSVEKSERLADMLKRRYGIRHNVLNAKQHESEADIIQDAGTLGSVMIATNMAGRGTDIKLRPIEREALIQHWKQRDLLPNKAEDAMPDDELIDLAYHHQAVKEFRLKKAEAEALSPQDAKLRLFRQWCTEDAFVEDKKAEKMALDECAAVLDSLPDYQRHRMALWGHAETMGGLHVVGTERHESRRIDNQLRGRSGRQGDNGSSRFFLSLEDDLMQMFAGDRTKAILSRLGMKEGDAIEHGMVSRSVERAQKKVEERNYQIRKNLLEYDEVMEYQRQHFYGTRQDVLEGKDIPGLIFEYLADAVDDACATYLAKDYTATQAAEWLRQHLDVSVDPSKITVDDREELEESARRAAIEEADSVIDITLGEYMSDDLPPDSWDLRGLQQWAMTRFSVNLSQAKLRDSNPPQVKAELNEAAREQLGKKDLSGLAKFVDPLYGAKDLSAWIEQKFGFTVEPDTLAAQTPEQASEKLLDQARDAYRKREVMYPIEFIMELFAQAVQDDQQQALGQLYEWSNRRFELGLTPDEFVQELNGKDIMAYLVDQNEQWMSDDGPLQKQAAEKAAQYRNDLDAVSGWMRERFAVELTEDEIETLKQDPEDLQGFIERRGREAMRADLTRLERFVLLQILDQAWKDHLYAMDQLKDSITLRGYAERDPRIEYKREGANQFQEMLAGVRDRVTELIFRARLSAGGPAPARQEAAQTTSHPSSQGSDGSSNSGGDDARRRPTSRRARRAADSRDKQTTNASGKKTRKRKSR